MTIGIIVFSLGLEDVEPSKCNVRLGQSAIRLARREIGKGRSIQVVSQWEPLPVIEQAGLRAVRIVGPNKDGSYLSGDRVFAEAAAHFQRQGIIKLILVVHPLAWPFVWLRAKLARFKVAWRWPGWIGFNRRSKQWQDRSAMRLLTYGAIQVFKGRAVKGRG